MLIERYNRFLDMFLKIDEKHRFFVKYEDIVIDPTVIYRTLNLQPSANNVLEGTGRIYKARHLPAPITQEFSNDIMSSVGRWHRDIMEEEAVLLVEKCRRLFEMGFY